MACTPFIYVVNKNFTVDAGGDFPLGSVIHQMCDECRLNGDGIICKSKGIFDVSVNVTFLIPTADSSSPVDGTISLQQDKTDVPGATATVTFGSATGKNQISLDAIVRNDTHTSSVLTLHNASTATISIVNCAVTVKTL